MMAQVCAWENLLAAWRSAARGKRGKPGVAAFAYQAADRLLEIQAGLRDGTWRPGEFVHFEIHSPKRRRISAAPFADRVVHHALCNVIGPVFERLFIADSYANRVGKGTHRAVDRLQGFTRRYRYGLRLDVVKHFPSIDHEILINVLRGAIGDEQVLALAARILASGDRVLEQEYEMSWFPGDDLWAAGRPRGVPVAAHPLVAAFVVAPSEAELVHWWVGPDGVPVRYQVESDFYLSYVIGESPAAAWGLVGSTRHPDVPIG